MALKNACAPGDLAVPYAAPRLAKMIALETPMNPKNAELGSQAASMEDAE